MKAFRFLMSGILMAGAVLLSSCDTVGPQSDSGVARVTLSLVTTGNGTASKGASQSIDITSAKILLRTIQFHARDDDSGSDSLEFRTAPIVAQLSLDGTPTELAVADLPLGSYHKVSFRIHKPDDNEMPPDPDFKIGTSGNERFSIIVEGSFNGQPYIYRSSKSMHQIVDFEEDLVIDENTGDANVSLLVNLSEWFVDRNGQVLDPNDTSKGNESRIDKSIRDSFRAFRDNNRDGRADS